MNLNNKIIFKNVNFKYENSENLLSLEDINFEINKGEFVTILGSNGSGKSTIAKLINGLLIPSQGSVTVDSLNTINPDDSFNIKKKVGIVFQNPDNQIIGTIVEDDIAFGPENLGLERHEIEKRITTSLQKVNMLDFRKSAPHMLSGGQKQRVAIAGVLAMEPEYIIFDESTSMLDPKGKDSILEIMKDLNKNHGISIILITHFIEESMLSDKIIVIHKSKVKLIDTPKEIFKFKNINFLRSINLDAPFIKSLCFDLKNCNINIKDDIFTLEELVDNLCL